MFHLLLDRETILDEPSRQHPLEETMYTCNNTDIYSNKNSKTDFSKEQIETTTDEEVAMVFSSSNLILCPPFSTETQVKKIPPLS